MADEFGPIGAFLLLGADDEVTYNWFHNGLGTESTTDANADGWRAIRDSYAEVLFLVKRGLAESRASWTGMAADGAHGAVSPVQAWVEQAVDSAAMASATVATQSIVFSDTKARLEPPVAVPDKPWWNDFWPGDTNYDKALEAKQANSIRNLDLVRSYGVATETNTAGYPDFGQPVVVATDVSQQPVPPDERGVGEWPTGPRPAAGREPGLLPGRPPTSSTVVNPGPATAGPSAQPVSPSQTVPGGQTPAPVATLPPSPSQDPVVTRNPAGGPGVAGLPGIPRPGLPDGAGFGGRAPGDRAGQPGTSGQPGAGGRAGGGLAGEAVTGRGAVAGARGGAGHPAGFVPAAGRASGTEDKEHTNKFGPVDWHDGFWDDTPPVSPAVIGLDEE